MKGVLPRVTRNSRGWLATMDTKETAYLSDESGWSADTAEATRVAEAWLFVIGWWALATSPDQYKRKWEGLVLEGTSAPDQYKRLGTFSLYDNNKYWFEDAEPDIFELT